MKLNSISLIMTSLWAAASIRSVRSFLPAGVPSTRTTPRGGAMMPLFLLDKVFGSTSTNSNNKNSDKYPIYADESVMSKKAHGTSDKPVQKELRWNCDYDTADRICNFNRHYAEYAGYWTSTDFLKDVKENWKEGDEPIQFYDSVTGKLLFKAPVGRSMDAFLKESSSHGWPSFRDEEVVWDDVRCLRDGECVSTTGTHLGHNIPDANGNRYCINLVSVAGKPEE